MSSQIFIEDDKRIEFNQFLTDFDPDINIPLGYSKDKIITSRGKHLNEMCIQIGHRILNGRTTGDCIGKLTCFTPNGCSVVDYFIIPEKLLSNTSFFKVHNLLGDLSDHCQISVLLNIQCNIKVEIDGSQGTPKKYKRNNDSTVLFQEVLLTNDI
jgi:hypothetical protein